MSVYYKIAIQRIEDGAWVAFIDAHDWGYNLKREDEKFMLEVVTPMLPELKQRFGPIRLAWVNDMNVIDDASIDPEWDGPANLYFWELESITPAMVKSWKVNQQVDIIPAASVSEQDQSIRHTAESVADAALKIVQSWHDRRGHPAGLVTEIEALVASVQSQVAIKADIIDPEHLELVSEWLFERFSDEPEWETWTELLGTEDRSGRARSVIAEWRTKAKGIIRDPMPVTPENPTRSFDSAIEDLAKIIVVATATYSNYDHYFDASSVMAKHLTKTVTSWAHQWSVPNELKTQMIQILVKRVNAPEMKARLDNGLSTSLGLVLRDRILGYHAISVLRDHNDKRANAQSVDPASVTAASGDLTNEWAGSANASESAPRSTTDYVDPKRIERAAEWLYNRGSDEPEWETWDELLIAAPRVKRANLLAIKWRAKAEARILNPMPGASDSIDGGN